MGIQRLQYMVRLKEEKIAHKESKKNIRKNKRRYRKSINAERRKQHQREAYPALFNFVTIGFNSTIRLLEAFVQGMNLKSDGSDLSDQASAAPRVMVNQNRGISKGSKHVAAIFVSRAEQPHILCSRLPILVYAASLAFPLVPPIKLVALPKGGETRLCKALQLPRIGFVGLMDNAPGASQLIELVRTSVPDVQTNLLHCATVGQFLPTKTNITKTSTAIQAKQGFQDDNLEIPRSMPSLPACVDTIVKETKA